MNTIHHPKSESGQAIVLLVFGMIVLMGMAGLAIDGGNLYTQKRRAQNAVDNAALAYALELSQGTGSSFGQTRATTVLSSNGYVNGQDSVTITMINPVPGYTNPDSYVEVILTQTVPTALIHLVYGGPAVYSARAIARGVAPQPLMSGYALAALKPGCDGSDTIGVQGRGGGSSGGTTITGAGAFVNVSCSDALDTSGSGEQFWTDGGSYPIDVVGGVNGSSCPSSPQPPTTSCNFNPAPTTGVPSVPQDPIQNTPAATPPTCGPSRTLSTELTDGDGAIVRPGTYTSFQPAAGDPTAIMSSGVYCVSGTISQGQNGVTGAGVLIYLTTSSAELDFSGQGDATLSAPTDSDCDAARLTTGDTSDDWTCTYTDIVIYKITGSNSCEQSDVEIDLTGGTSLNITGLIYAPYSLARYGGSGSLTMTGQSLVACVKFNGNGSINIVYDPDKTYVPPPSLQLTK